MNKLRVLIAFGTRPEAIKLAPVIQELTARREKFTTVVAVTAQHRQMLDQPLETFNIKVDYDLNIMKAGQDLFDITVNAMEGLRDTLKKESPDLVLVQGDTTTTFAASLAAFYLRTPVGHIEAGLRTHQRYNPFPEEINRRLTGVISEYHFAPTPLARENLMRENVPPETIFVTGNTTIDALKWVLGNTSPDFSREILNIVSSPFILVTAHRRESFGKPMENIMLAIGDIAEVFDGYRIIFPVHFSPDIRKAAGTYLKNRKNIYLMDPLDYRNFCHLMSRASLILTDSGGIQEEAPSIGRPVLVLRETTERPEGIAAGNLKLVGTERSRIFEAASRLLTDSNEYHRMAQVTSPYGDGRAAVRIADILSDSLGVEPSAHL